MGIIIFNLILSIKVFYEDIKSKNYFIIGIILFFSIFYPINMYYFLIILFLFSFDKKFNL